MSIDLESLKARLAEYDPNAPKCPQRVSRHSNYAPDHVSSSDSTYHDYDMATHSPCCRPEGHEGECRNSRSVMGWPGFATVSALLTEIERLRSINDECLLNMGRQHAKLREQARDAAIERSAIVAWLRAEAEAAAQTFTLQAGQWANRIDGLADDIARGEHCREEKEE